MFTGLVESTGTITQIENLGEQARYTVQLPFYAELALGDSVATNGCCLTVASLDQDTASFDILSQTLKVTSLGHLKVGSLVNLERALRPSDRLGGHFVQGHVDGTGEILDLSEHGQDHRFEVSLPESIYKYCIGKGSLAVDGISLTIAELTDNSAVFWITPHTFEHTNLADKKLGDPVNLEADLLAKYTEKLLSSKA
ncbi:riboflavin synthase alpha chain [Rubritalea squalenifaciens DSM 18772]|uniref:Riboflavin synthase n=1 Tax=Rubritalea squalenifaciens DSM 18772 TaxID=1123071 RepID=A0A1M6IHA7_9BACT|nr:riboflavin synthase [Rubritalea squalenifaciens]SHJ33819.1 riboflavin synthase alpha chain [Rubritalea squalenifaciens DSM 18772]